MVPKILSKLCDRDLANSLPRSGGFNEASEQLDSHQVWMIKNIQFPNKEINRNGNFLSVSVTFFACFITRLP